jgi:hypothetical protein
MIMNRAILNIQYPSARVGASGDQGDGNREAAPDRERGSVPVLRMDDREYDGIACAHGDPSQSGAQQETVNTCQRSVVMGKSDSAATLSVAQGVRTAGECEYDGINPHGFGETTQLAGRTEGGCVSGSGTAMSDCCSVRVPSAVLWGVSPAGS